MSVIEKENRVIVSIDDVIMAKGEDAIIQTDYSEVTVVPTIALKNISLQSVPYVVQEAIDAAKLDAKDLALTDGILTDIKDRLLLVEDEKTTKFYVDEQLTFLEELISQKATPEAVAAIIDTKVAIATEDFVSTAQVNGLTSRVDDSEASIANLAETINTTDSARATQINEVEARVNENLSNYSDVLDLTVDENGDVKAQKLETLQTEVDGQLAGIIEAKTIAQDANSKWEANASTLITAPDGKLTGISAKASDSISEIVVNADKFKIESSIGTPFSVIDGEIYNNGKVNFTKNPTIATKEDLKDLRTIEWVNENSDLNISQSGINNVFQGTSTDSSIKYNLKSKLAYENGCIFSFSLKRANLNDEEYAQKTLIRLIDTNTNQVGLELDFIFRPLWENFIPYDIDSAKYFIEGQETQYFENNPTATQTDYENQRRYYYKTDGTPKYTWVDNGAFSSVKLPKNFEQISFAYTNEELIVYEDGLIRYSVPTTSERTFRLEFQIGYVDVNNSNPNETAYDYYSDFDVYKWDRYYNNSNLLSEISDLSLSLTNLSSTTANEQFALNAKILEEAQDRLAKDALLDGKITDEETARINALGVIKEEYKNYTDVVTKALADEVITQEERNLIDVAWNSVQAAKNRLTSIETNVTNLQNDLTNVSWQDEVQAALDSDTTTIDGGKIVSSQAFLNTLNAMQITAKDITATEINGVTINGGVINGARINGAVIAASYLDLDGELEVLTNYHIPVSTYNSNPSNYIDAVYVDADNEYRIPSVSQIKSIAGHPTVLSTGIRSYNNANSGHNNKCVRIRPFISVTSQHRLHYGFFNALSRSTVYYYKIYLCGVEQCSIYKTNPTNNDNVYLHIRDSVTGSVSSWTANFNHTRTSSHVLSKTLSCGLNIRIDIAYFYSYIEAGGDAGIYITTANATFNVYLESSYITVATDFTSGDLMTASISSGTGYSPANICTINNMV